nr:VapE domain-containing protein [Nitrosomonas nitrosa]
MTDLPNPNPDASVDFLKWYAPQGMWVLMAIATDKKSINTQTFVPADEHLLRSWLKEHGTKNIYFHVNPTTRALRKKAEREDIKELAWLHVDIDPRVGEDIESERTRALGLLQQPRDGIPKPSAIIFSGGGYQGFWRLEDPMPINGEETAYEEAKLYNLALELSFGADHCHNVDRIMRLPGTINWPDKKKAAKGRVPTLAEVVELNDVTYCRSGFKKAPASPGAVAKRAVTANSIESLDELTQWGLPERVKVIITEGQVAEARPGKDTSRSGWVWDVMCQLVRCGVPDNVIHGVLTDSRWRISESVLEKTDPQRYVARQLANAKAVVSDDIPWPSASNEGVPRRCYANARVALLRIGVRCSHDTFRDRQLINGAAVQQYVGEVSDHACAILRQAILERFALDVGKENIRDAVHELALENAFDPVRDYLVGLRWDGQTRLDTWLSVYLGAEASPLNAEIGRKLLVAAVRRVMQPGCKFDYIPVLEGPQGSGKSTALRILAGHDDTFSDQEIVHLETKAQQEAVRGKWLYEIAELSGLSKTDVEKTKAFLSRTHDRARPAYGYHSVDQPRRCVFIGTTNERNYLKDPTGNRRFWPVATGRIDLEALAKDRDQLWAEAVAVEAAGEPLFLSPAVAADIDALQEDRRDEEPWLDHLARIQGEIGNGEERIATSEVLWKYLAIPTGKETKSDTYRVRDAMRRLGWVGPKKLRIRGRSVWGYHRPCDPPFD